jgi:predicted RNA binding protein YcfA (HicA-like mRNA interferase family)
MKAPQHLHYADIERVLRSLGFEKIPAKGSHVKWKHSQLRNDVIIPVHNGECKTFYKEHVRSQIRILIKK